MKVKVFTGIVLFVFSVSLLLSKKGISYRESKGVVLIPAGIILIVFAVMDIKILNDGFIVNILGEKGTRAFYLITGLAFIALGIYKYSIFF